MHFIVLTFLSLALLLTVVAFLKERRLRLALQRLLSRLFHYGRSHETDTSDDDPPADDRDPDLERV